MDTKTTKTEKKPRTAAKPATDKKPRVLKKKTEDVSEVAAMEAPVETLKIKVPAGEAGRYMFATGRRKTSVSNVRLFTGEGKSVVNKKPFDVYFFNDILQGKVNKPLDLTGLAKSYYMVVTVNGGGMNAQADATANAIAKALATLGDDVKKVLKKNGLLTRDDRKKERKKPGLRRARRAPQWAKR